MTDDRDLAPIPAWRRPAYQPDLSSPTARRCAELAKAWRRKLGFHNESERTPPADTDTDPL